MKLGVPLLSLFLICAATGFKVNEFEYPQEDFSDDFYRRDYKVDDYFDDIYPEKDYPAYGSLEDEFRENSYPLDYELMKDYPRKKKNDPYESISVVSEPFENDGEIIDNLDYQQDPVLGYEHIGCYRDNIFRAISGEKVVFSQNDVIQSCYKRAQSLGYRFFAVEFGKECFTSSNAGRTYSKFGRGSGCRGGRGGFWTMDVYRIKETPTPKVSLEISGDNSIQLRCSFVPVRNDMVYEVRWFSVGKNGDADHSLYAAILPANEFSHFLIMSPLHRYIGNTIYARLRSWKPGQEGADPIYKESNRYFLGFKLSPTTLTVSPGTPVVLTITSTVPILCDDGSSNCTVRVTLESDPIILLSSCSIVFAATRTFPSRNTVTVTAKDGFVNYKNVQVTISVLSVKYNPSTSPNSDWKTPTSPGSVDVTTSSGGHSGQCTSTGDPHIRTFDNLYFNHYYVGDYTLMKSTSRDFEVQVRTHRCATVACNCGVAVREGDDILVVDMCRNGFTPRPRYANNREPARGTYIERSPNGKHFILKFASGTVVKYNAKHWFANNYYADIIVQVTSVDYGKTAGLCGKFDGQKSNDMTSKNGVVTRRMCGKAACRDFTESWKVSRTESFFNVNEIHEQLQCLKKVGSSHCMCGKEIKDQVCNVVPEPPILKSVTKGYVKLAFTGQAKCNELRKKEGGGDGGNNKDEKVVVLPTCKSDCVYPVEPTTEPPTIPDWPTTSGITEPKAKEICQEGFEKSPIYQKCTGYLTAEMRKGFLDQCIADIQIMDIKGTKVAIKGAMEALQEKCVDLITKDPDNLDKDGKVPDDILDKTCPNDCSGNGDCEKGKCSCNKGFVTEDCSISIGQKPNPISISGAKFCERGSPEECTDVTIIGKDLIPGMVHCLITPTQFSLPIGGPVVVQPSQLTLPIGLPVVVPATLISFSEVECRLPKAGNCGDKLFGSVTFEIKLINGNDRADAADKVLKFHVGNKNCYNCSEDGCRQRAGCVVDNCCYSNGDSDPKDKKCSWCPSTGMTQEFSRRKDVDGCYVHPCEIGNGGCSDKCDQTTNEAVCQCTKPGKVIAADGKSCVHPCEIENGGCSDKCDKTTNEAVCQCNTPGYVIGGDGKSCVHPCDIENGGCGDKCDKTANGPVCQCTKPGKVIGTDGKSCVHPCEIKNGGCSDKCDKTTNEAVCQCNKPDYVIGADGKSCVHPCDIENGGCGDKCDKTANGPVCQCTKPGKVIGTDGKSCVHPCEIENGGCGDKCNQTTNEAVCQCTKPGKVIGADGKSCECSNVMCRMYCNHGFEKDEDGCTICKCKQVPPTECPNVMCMMYCNHGFEKDEDGCTICKCKQVPPPGCSNTLCKMACEYGYEVDAFGCALCRCKVPSPGHTSYTKINISVHSTYSGNNGPHLSLHMTLNPRLHQSRFVPESCYAGRTESEFDPVRFYIIRNRFPTLRSRVRYTPTTFELTCNAAEAERLRQLVESAERPHIKCRLRICPLPSNSCNFGYRSQISRESYLDRILKEKRQKMLNFLDKELSLKQSDDYEEDEIVYVDAKLQ